MNYLKNKENFLISEELKYHIDNDISLSETIFRPYSKSFFNLLKESRDLYEKKQIVLVDDNDKYLFNETEIGIFGLYEGIEVPLDVPFFVEDSINEAEYKGKDVKLNHPMRGGSKKYYVYVKDPKSKKIKKIEFGDTSGLNAKVSDPDARKSFAARHKCDQKKDKTKAGYWACRINRYAHLWNNKTYPGYW